MLTNTGVCLKYRESITDMITTDSLRIRFEESYEKEKKNIKQDYKIRINVIVRQGEWKRNRGKGERISGRSKLRVRDTDRIEKALIKKANVIKG